MEYAVAVPSVDPAVGKLRREWRFDLIDAHFGHPEGIAAAMLARWFRCPFFVTMRGGDETDKARAPGIRWVMQWALMEDRVITVSDPLRTFAISMGVPAARVAVIPNGIDSGVFYPRNRADERPRLAERLARILRAAIRLE